MGSGMRITDDKILIKGLKSLETETPPSLYSDVMRAVRTYQEKRNPLLLWAGLGSAVAAVAALAIFVAVPKQNNDNSMLSSSNGRAAGSGYALSQESGKEPTDASLPEAMLAKQAPSSDSSAPGATADEIKGMTVAGQPKILMLTDEGFIVVNTFTPNPEVFAQMLQAKLEDAHPTLSSSDGTSMVTLLVPSNKADDYLDQIAQTNSLQNNFMEVQKIQNAPKDSGSVRILVHISK